MVPFDNQQIIKAVVDITGSGSTATADAIAAELDVTVDDISDQLAALTVAEVLRQGSTDDEPGFWYRLGRGAAAKYLTEEQYEAYEHRVGQLASRRGLRLLVADPGNPPPLKLYALADKDDEGQAWVGGTGDPIEDVDWQLSVVN